MIVRVQGILDTVGQDWVYINLGGVTLQVFVPTSAINDLGPQGSKVSLFTHLRIRDEQPIIYGFPSAASMELFLLLTGVSGVGPRIGLALLSSLGAPGLRQAIATRDRLRGGDLSAADLTEACLAEVEAARALNAFVHHTPEIARAQAAAADARLGAGDAPDMCGIPLGIKDLFCTRGVPSQAASRSLEGFRPEYESRVTQNLFDAGAVMLGKLNMDEFAMGSSNETSAYGNVVSPMAARQ